MDEGFDRSPVDKRDDYYSGRSGRDSGAAAGRRTSRSRSPLPPSKSGGGRARSRSASRDRRRSSHRDSDRDTRDRDSGGRRDRSDRDSRRRSRSRSRSRDRRRRDDSPPPAASRSSRNNNNDDEVYPGSSTRGGYGGGGFSSRGGGGGFRGRGGFGRGGHHSSGPPPDPVARAANREALAQEAIQKSKKENRVYVGNLSFQVRWHDLKEFCSSAGNVVFSEIIQLPNGMSKGCGVVEYATREEAQRAIKELNEGDLFGRPVFLREDREEEARFGQAAVSNRTSFPGAAFQTGSGGGSGGPAPRGGGGGAGPGVPAVFAPPGPRGLYVTGMSFNIGWQDLKDLFRAAGTVLRADINMDHTTGQSKGTGVVVMESKTEAMAAIAMFNGYEFDGGRLEVREDRFYHINAARGAHGGLPGARGGGFRGGFRGGFGGGGGGHMGFSSGHGATNSGGSGSGRNTDNLYGDYTGPEGAASAAGTDGEAGAGDVGAGAGDVDMSSSSAAPGAGFGGHGSGPGGFRGGRGGGGFRGGFRGGFGGPTGPAAFGGGERNFDPIPAAPSTQIFVKNLPWSTSNEDLVELFQTTGTVQEAEVLWEGGRSKGNGVVQFASIEEAETAIAKFQNYQYGGRPLGLAFNARWKDFSAGGGSGVGQGGDASAADYVEGDEANGNGGEEMPIEGTEQLDTREQMMEGM